MATLAPVDHIEKEIVGRGARSLPFGGGCAIALGGVFLALGLMFAAAVAVLFVARSDALEQKWLAPPAVLFLLLIGAGLVRRGISDQRRLGRGRHLAALHPDQPWFADATWDPQGTPAQPSWDGTTTLIVLFVLLVMAPFNVLWAHVFDPREEPMMRLLALMVLIPDFFMYLIGRGLVSMARERIRYGRPYLRHDAFPFALGGELRGWVTARRFAGQAGVGATLRCIDERMVTVYDSTGNPTDTVRPYQLYEVRCTFPGVFGGEEVPLTLPLPEGPPTALLRQPPRYWELEVAGNEPADAVRFIVPVYAC